MNWIAGIQNAIDYMEENITQELDYNEIAKRACSSSFHFQRVFGILCGYTLGEYIRGRRLTLAGMELAYSDSKVIDVALKYAYDNPESFSRAFVKFHGIKPSQAKNAGANLKSFSKLFVKLVLEGGTIMNYRIEAKKEFKVIAKTKSFSTKDDSNLQEIPKFWTRSKTDGTIATLCGYGVGSEFEGKVLGICYGDGCDKEFTYSIATGYNGKKPVPKEFCINEMPARTWAIFKCKGAMPEAIQDLWRKIYTEFFPTSEYVPKNEIDFESYSAGDMNSVNYESEIWVAVEKQCK
ncbi:MAG: AraC family transcriptional regulator [Acidaminococcaceae bacterium]|nr:AraC family transcriptional regulator [Acidaminococcaceae bacterium]